ncbi:hypothetical protein H9L10_03545 [Phycicoccus endophyticus]|uniref:HK97 gp10 family phage protein n=1 Tax=Phycicoccus endophyticus TaxID=1690220 RepID=A0A7G9R3G8_9MICO|nr:HK97 gp10 family phage protein [Phycicoccus endophyticus]NHI19899.1 hypothetical protein [Phycicoccus endophyticus]QNN50143.1 hypothetical protein H9L10_03545 [Phycicoccus endophyticus]GGL27658.1 hypothetical protein GCM10012283_07340 [Phycicoccus endophyticus]
MNEITRWAQALRRAASGLERKAEQAVDRVGRGALRDAELYAPVGATGNLRRGLRLRRDGHRAVITSSEYYSAFQEYGTSQMAPNPFIDPAAREWGPRLVLEVERLRDGIERDL